MRSMTRVRGSGRPRRALIFASVAASAAMLTACGGAGGGGATKDGAPAAALNKDDKLMLTVYSKFTSREFDIVTKGLNNLKAKFPNIEIKHEGNQDDDKLTSSICGGNPPDVAISFFTDNLGALVLHGQLHRPEALHRARQDRHQHHPGRGAQLHRVRRQAMRDADARRRLRLLRQHRHAQSRRAQRGPEDHQRAVRVTRRS